MSKRGARLEDLLAKLDPSAARLAEAAVDWLLPEGAGLEALGQLDLQEFLWYELPNKWMTSSRELHEVAWSLGDLLTAAGLDRYAAVCRAEDTHLLIDRWQEDREAANRALGAAMESSGVDPLDTDLLAWGATMGMAEYSARHMASRALEQAIDTGELAPGERGWKRRAQQVIDAALTVPQVANRGRSVLQDVRGERAERWAVGPPEARRELLGAVVPLREEEPGVPDDVAVSLRPLGWLLERLGDGVTLTQAEYLPRALVREADEEFGWFDLPGFRVRTETDLTELHRLHGFARQTRLVTKRRRRLTVSAAGRKVLRDPALLWSAVVAGLFEGQTFAQEGAALGAAVLLADVDTPVAADELDGIVAAAMQGRWRNSDGSDLDHWARMRATSDLRFFGELFGWLELGGDWQHRTLALTPSGRQAAWLGLRMQACAPRTRP